MNELEQFLSGLDTDQNNDDPFAHVETPETTGEPQVEVQTETDTEPKPRNRRERRLEAKLEAERQSAIELANRLQALTEAQQSRAGDDYLTAVERIYGTESPEAREAGQILKTALQQIKEEAKREALEAVNETRELETKAVRDAEERLDTMVDEIADEFGVDLTPEQEADFFRLMERMSPKDRNGNIVEYADHFAVWEVYESRMQRTDPTAKTLAARSMTTSAGAIKGNLTQDTNERFLRDNDLI